LRDRGFPTRGAKSFGFWGRGVQHFGYFGCGAGDGYVESDGGMFSGHSPPHDQYEFGRGRSFESQRGYIPRFPFVVLVLLQRDMRWFPVVVIALIDMVG
jgi:hypothetical protein